MWLISSSVLLTYFIFNPYGNRIWLVDLILEVYIFY